MVEGKITHVGADASDGQGQSGNHGGQTGTDPNTPSTQLPSTYKAIVTLAQQNLEANGTRFQLTPGMQVVAEVNQGQRTIMEYLLSPVQKAFREAGRER